MSKRSEFIDYIKSMLTKLGIGTLLEYEQDFFVTDYTDNTLPSWKKVKDYADGTSNPILKTFTSSTGPVINWQTDSPDGETSTYYQLFGNRVEGFVYTTFPLGQPYTWTLDGSSNVNVVTFDFGSSQTGYIHFF